MKSNRARYRSNFEFEMASVLVPSGFEYEPYAIPYWTPGKYTPDFVLGPILVECKGYFRPGDQKKYKAVIESLDPDEEELVFLLQYPNKRVRKGAQLTMSMWCEKHGIQWFATPEEVVAHAHARRND